MEFSSSLMLVITYMSGEVVVSGMVSGGMLLKRTELVVKKHKYFQIFRLGCRHTRVARRLAVNEQ